MTDRMEASHGLRLLVMQPAPIPSSSVENSASTLSRSDPILIELPKRRPALAATGKRCQISGIGWSTEFMGESRVKNRHNARRYRFHKTGTSQRTARAAAAKTWQGSGQSLGDKLPWQTLVSRGVSLRHAPKFKEENRMCDSTADRKEEREGEKRREGGAVMKGYSVTTLRGARLRIDKTRVGQRTGRSANTNRIMSTMNA